MERRWAWLTGFSSELPSFVLRGEGWGAREAEGAGSDSEEVEEERGERREEDALPMEAVWRARMVEHFRQQLQTAGYAEQVVGSVKLRRGRASWAGGPLEQPPMCCRDVDRVQCRAEGKWGRKRRAVVLIRGAEDDRVVGVAETRLPLDAVAQGVRGATRRALAKAFVLQHWEKAAGVVPAAEGGLGEDTLPTLLHKLAREVDRRLPEALSATGGSSASSHRSRRGSSWRRGDDVEVPRMPAGASAQEAADALERGLTDERAADSLPSTPTTPLQDYSGLTLSDASRARARRLSRTRSFADRLARNASDGGPATPRGRGRDHERKLAAAAAAAAAAVESRAAAGGAGGAAGGGAGGLWLQRVSSMPEVHSSPDLAHLAMVQTRPLSLPRGAADEPIEAEGFVTRATRSKSEEGGSRSARPEGPTRRRLRVLFLCANPMVQLRVSAMSTGFGSSVKQVVVQALNQLDHDEELGEICRALQGAGFADADVWRCVLTRESLRVALQSRFDIVHISSHGLLVGPRHTDRPAGLVVELSPDRARSIRDMLAGAYGRAPAAAAAADGALDCKVDLLYRPPQLLFGAPLKVPPSPLAASPPQPSAPLFAADVSADAQAGKRGADDVAAGSPAGKHGVGGAAAAEGVHRLDSADTRGTTDSEVDGDSFTTHFGVGEVLAAADVDALQREGDGWSKERVPRVVFVAACHSKSMGTTFAQLGVPFVAGVDENSAPREEVATAFATCLYRRILARPDPARAAADGNAHASFADLCALALEDARQLGVDRSSSDRLIDCSVQRQSGEEVPFPADSDIFLPMPSGGRVSRASGDATPVAEELEDDDDDDDDDEEEEEDHEERVEDGGGEAPAGVAAVSGSAAAVGFFNSGDERKEEEEEEVGANARVRCKGGARTAEFEELRTRAGADDVGVELGADSGADVGVDLGVDVGGEAAAVVAESEGMEASEVRSDGEGEWDEGNTSRGPVDALGQSAGSMSLSQLPSQHHLHAWSAEDREVAELWRNVTPAAVRVDPAEAIERAGAKGKLEYISREYPKSRTTIESELVQCLGRLAYRQAHSTRARALVVSAERGSGVSTTLRHCLAYMRARGGFVGDFVWVDVAKHAHEGWEGGSPDCPELWRRIMARLGAPMGPDSQWEKRLSGWLDGRLLVLDSVYSEAIQRSVVNCVVRLCNSAARNRVVLVDSSPEATELSKSPVAHIKAAQATAAAASPHGRPACLQNWRRCLFPSGVLPDSPQSPKVTSLFVLREFLTQQRNWGSVDEFRRLSRALRGHDKYYKAPTTIDDVHQHVAEFVREHHATFGRPCIPPYLLVNAGRILSMRGLHLATVRPSDDVCGELRGALTPSPQSTTHLAHAASSSSRGVPRSMSMPIDVIFQTHGRARSHSKES